MSSTTKNRKNNSSSKRSSNITNSGNNKQQQQSVADQQPLQINYEYQSFKHWIWINRVTTLMIVFGMFRLYMSNGEMTVGGDSNSNMLLSLRLAHVPPSSLLSSSGVELFGLTPRDTPCLFQWKFWADPKNAIPRSGLSLAHWNQTASTVINGKVEPRSAWQLYEMGRLKVDRPHYFLVDSIAKSPSQTPDNSAVYASTFGIGTALTSAPIFRLYTARYPVKANDYCQYSREHLLYISKLSASLFSAISCGVMFQVFLELISRDSIDHSSNFMFSFLLTILYGLGTTLASINSQALWQHAPNTMFLSIGLYCYIKLQSASSSNKSSIIYAISCAFALSMATICRPTSALYPLAVLSRMLVNCLIPGKVGFKKQFIRLFAYGVTGAILGAAFLYHNQLFFGSPFITGQTIAAEQLAPAKTGLAEGTWTTPLWTGLSTLLFSPSRGLFVHSPFLIFSIVSLFFSDKSTITLLAPFMASTAILTYAASTFFDYWGGWCFGPRPLTDLMPTLLAMIGAGITRMKRIQPLVTLLVCTGILAIIVQMIGMYAYDPMIWNYQKAVRGESETDLELISNFEVLSGKQADPAGTVMVNIDDPPYRWRLWDWNNGQPFYLLKNFGLARKMKKYTVKQWVDGSLT
ncbi:hypothetical protein PPL_05708 [Heterostelium album PN500]|uniref:Glycosyltransferase RgtA/B/C/D-like domain-containing protein n=1 Tax=Heterostelium pallidum (strain ATCC 26659 / Pp 5 / PN500) TaxID=670386 RepID=D3BAX7_HETP5|nr:hypothetical protein PPL_05708 [Heterostelium album PN500]EFA81714.1 hypothetical protein PPL_05708 [Heterostelium album PN500]|eukprot:XP_020433831.1 hypothetical protein PPL_05708 [Heterostelium album PN500]